MFYGFLTLLLAGAVAGDCNADNCLRALRATQTPGRLQSARSFCATFAKQSVAATAIPTYAAEACKQNQNGPPSLRISSACSCIASYTPPPTSSPAATGACAKVSSSAAAQRSVSPSATPTVAAQLAHDCLESVPLNKQAALDLVDSMVPYIEWQSDIAFKKDPPSTYFYPPHDILGYVASVKSNLQQNVYANEYAFQQDLYQVFARSHDGHFIFYPDLLTKALEWGRKQSLVSISKDGSSIPQIKLYNDVVASPSTAPTLTKINGVDAAKYVAEFAFTATLNQDADAAFNSMFYEKAYAAAGAGNGYFAGGGRVRYIYPGANTTLTFDNGTTVTLENFAKVKGDFTGVTDGKSFYQQFCTGPKSSVASTDAAAVAPVPGYPTPIISTGDGIVSGYYLNGQGYQDVAVISLLAFENESPKEFQQVAEKFFAKAVKDGKTKLVIDLSANGGGYILQGYDLFRQLFPDIIQDGFSRWREPDTLLAIAKSFSDRIPSDYDPNTAPEELINIYENFFNYRYDYNITNKPFPLFDAKFGPEIVKGDPYTQIVRWNLNDPLLTSNETFGLGTDITGYGSRKNFTQPFAKENIIMLMDGFCASTCTLFSEFMRSQAGIKVIAMGGQPQSGQIQAVGGIKGAQILSWQAILFYAQTALQTATATAEQKTILNRLTDLPIKRSSSNGINVRDQIRAENLDDGVPAQFVYEPADCRLYWTAPMITDITEVWKGAAKAAFNGGKCVAGGLPKRDLEADILERELDEGLLQRAERVIERREVQKQTDIAWVARMGRKVII